MSGLSIPRLLVEFILLGPEDDRRQLQDSPILGDVWIKFAEKPGSRLHLLITPYKETPAGAVAEVIDDLAATGQPEADHNIAYLQGIVAATLTFEEVLRYVVPMTSWWCDKGVFGDIEKYAHDRATLEESIGDILRAAQRWFTERTEELMKDRETRKRYIALAGLILWAQRQTTQTSDVRVETRQRILALLSEVTPAKIVDAFRSVYAELPKPGKPLVWTVSLNRRATPALMRSVPAVKADAARTLFRVNCSEIVWAVLDSGIDATHPAFLGAEELGDDGKPVRKTRVRKTFDFTSIRDIVTLDNLRSSSRRDKRVADLLDRKLKEPIDAAQANTNLEQVAKRAKQGRAINWELVQPLVELDPMESPPLTNHGTHVAGIIGASQEVARQQSADAHDGMCPDIGLYDFRVLARSMEETEFAIIAALQYIRYLNERNSYITIHGANLSLSIPHDVRNYACGRTPICNECERMVNSGVVVVTAAGNRGYQNFETQDGVYEGYAAFSVTDPGNADGVITVGATHRYWPHTYGVSFFSSRGPTGDGRVKPDLVAPGERIRAPLPNGQWGDLDGTSMAAPHVSGAAAMLVARYSELVGQPRRIKEILCNSATDLGREKTFQGHGMLDVLRAFQSI
jgi:hypothetical protein